MQEIIAYFIQNLTALYIAVALLSLCIGSFLNVVIYRTPQNDGTRLAAGMSNIA